MENERIIRIIRIITIIAIVVLGDCDIVNKIFDLPFETREIIKYIAVCSMTTIFGCFAVSSFLPLRG